MREFSCSSDCKINFVDNNDVLVGFDNSSSCCENFGWFYTETLPTSESLRELTSDPKTYESLRAKDRIFPENLDKYCFDPEFFQQLPGSSSESRESAYWDDTQAAIFRLVWDQKVLYLCLFNSHNGYYSHGFQMDVKGQKLRDGSL